MAGGVKLISDYRPIDELATFATSSASGAAAAAPTRYAVRQVLAQEVSRLRSQMAAESRAARGSGALLGMSRDVNVLSGTSDKENLPPASKEIGKAGSKGVKRDFFGRVIVNEESVGRPGSAGGDEGKGRPGSKGGKGNGGRIWVSYHEGFSNAVRKPIGLKELMDGL